MADLTDRPVLVLNTQWLAVHICTVRRALSLLYQDLAQVVDDDYQTFDFDAWVECSEILATAHEPLLRAPGFALKLPMVIVLRHYQKCPPRRVRFNRHNVYGRDRHCCQYCGDTAGRADLTIDHVVPRSRGGKSEWGNVVAACVRCNTKKGDRLPAECGMIPLTKPRVPSWHLSLRISANTPERRVWRRFLPLSAAEARA